MNLQPLYQVSLLTHQVNLFTRCKSMMNPIILVVKCSILVEGSIYVVSAMNAVVRSLLVRKRCLSVRLESYLLHVSKVDNEANESCSRQVDRVVSESLLS